jgi:hypothetical protein
VSSLKSIEQLPNLCRFNVIAVFDDGDLAVHAPLTHLGIEGLRPGSYENLDALPRLPLLRKFRCSDGPAVDPWILNEKGMTVKIYRWAGN